MSNAKEFFSKPIRFEDFKMFTQGFTRGWKIVGILWHINLKQAYFRVVKSNEALQSFKKTVKATSYLCSFCVEHDFLKDPLGHRTEWVQMIQACVTEMSRYGVTCPRWGEIHKYIPFKERIPEFFKETYPGKAPNK